jgi:predicted MFS family arabinose efflux permease
LYPYYSSFGLTLQDFLLVQSIFAIAVVLFEFPTGYIGDRFGHHRSIQLGLLCSTAGWVVMCFSQSFTLFAIAEICMALGSALISGSDSALAYDSAQVTGVSYKSIENRIQTTTSFSEAFGALAGTLLVMYGVHFVIIVHTCVLSLAALLAHQLAPVRAIKKSKLGALADMYAVARYAATHVYVRNLIWLGGLVSSLTISAVWFLQPYLTLAHIPLWMFGIIWFAQNAVLGLVSLVVGRVESWLGDAHSLVAIVVMPIGGLVLLGIVPIMWASVGIFLLFIFTRALLRSYSYASLQHHALADRRASIMSIQGLVFRLFFAIIAPVTGYISIAYSLQAACIVLAAISAVGISIPALYLYREPKVV